MVSIVESCDAGVNDDYTCSHLRQTADVCGCLWFFYPHTDSSIATCKAVALKLGATSAHY